MTTYIKDLIDIPEHVHAGDFVLKLAEGVNRADDTLRQYVVTPQLADCFDQALALVRGALTDGTSKGAYLHGSFGSGKSHFMPCSCSCFAITQEPGVCLSWAVS